ncbi:hypothetical protein KNN17_20955 [Arthrobacter bambusae]|uniref:hypothetical protein n=1 Tax=Arthrobacter TaxID=1663 RepID=UPI001F50A7DD|nr:MULTISPECIES: hypothetical protein [Arthrobacter]MCI0144033.1 hypothetical protein [Arthrobacter bambusae]UYY83559.1 hypothetical protein OIT41_20110 [Arthrobacter sp. YA7-1]
MNEHGKHAMETMKKHDPQAFAQIVDPEKHFSMLGEEIQQAIRDLSEELTPIRGSEPPLEYIGLVNMAKLRAREMVYQEMIYAGLPAEPEDMEPSSARQEDEQD